MSLATSTTDSMESVAAFARRAARWTEHRLERVRFDLWHAADAGRAYDVLRSHDPDRRLDRRTLRRIDAYARETLGSRVFAPWLRVYTAWAGEFREGWIPDNYYGRVVHARTQVTPARLCLFKTVARRLLQTELIPDLAYRVGGTWLDLDGAPVSDEDIDELVFADGDRVVAKFDASSQGRGVHVLTRGHDSVRDLEGRGDFVVQRFIRQSAFFDRFTHDSVATVRITTVRTPDRPAHTRAHYLRLGRGGESSVASASNVRVPIVDADGTLGATGALANWEPVGEHPDTGTRFSCGQVPAFARACRAVEALHDSLPQVEVIGWDVAITAAEDLRIMEWNAGHSDIKFSEATIGPCFRGLGWEDRWRR
jgi:hypothetical protein